MRLLLIGILLFGQAFYLSCQSNNLENFESKTDTIKNDNEKLKNKENESNDEISFLFLGDIMSHDLQIQSAYDAKTNKYDFSSEFKDIQPIINDVDAVVGNLEVTLAGPPYKGYPLFSSPDQLPVDIKNAGINYLVTSNNHAGDRGMAGFKRTLNVLDSIGFVHTGTFRDQIDMVKRHPMVIKEKGWRIALFNYSYGLNEGTYNSKMLINFIDKDLIEQDLKEAVRQKYDAIIVFFHWGDEYARTSNKEQKEIAKMCYENGANVVIGAHPHVIQEMEKYRFTDSKGVEKDVLTVYSLGNYVSNYAERRYSNGGALARFKLRKTSEGEIRIEEQGYYLVYVYRKAKIGKYKTYYVLPVDMHELDNSLDKVSASEMKTFIDDSRSHLKTYNNNVNEYQYNKLKNSWEVDWK